MSAPQIGLQLYTLRDLTKTDFAGASKEAAARGYEFVEMAGYGNLASAKEARKALDDAGLKVCGQHAALPELEKNIEPILDDCETLGTTLLVCPWLPEERRKDAAGWKKSAKDLNAVARAAHERGIDFAYHNHSFEFQKFDGKNGLDLLFENSEPHLVRAELDVYWVKHGGADPVAYIKQLGERVISLHLKDMAAGEERRFAPVGTGILDFAAILKAASEVGVKWGIVEQDKCYDTPPLESIKTSRENLKKLGF